MSGAGWKRYAHREMHMLLIKRSLSPRWHDTSHDEIGAQAIFCPYYVPLEGTLGSDWGVIVNPKSTRFGLLTFEHDDCGCPDGANEDGAGWNRHTDTPTQDGDMWADTWHHVCDPYWCDSQCEAAQLWGATA